MPLAVPAGDFVAAWRATGGSPAAVSRATGLTIRNVYARRARLEAQGYALPTTSGHADNALGFAYTPRLEVAVENGCAVIFSDRHWWPGDGVTPAEAALLALLPRLDPDLLIANGDVLDAAGLSRHDPLGHERKPGVAEELATVQLGMRRIAEHAKRAKKMRTTGNHCLRFDRAMARSGPGMAGIVGVRLSDHLPDWTESWSIHINAGFPGGHTVVKHRIGGGVTAARTNAIKSGVHIVTGHTHRLDAHPVQTYAGRHWGVQCGMLGNPGSAAFEYAEDGPDHGAPGFVVLTWRDGLLQPPELVECDDAGVAWFRGEPVTVKPRVRVPAR